MKIDIQLEKKYLDHLNLLLKTNRADPNTFVSEVVKSRIDEIEQVKDDVQKFQDYVQAHPRGKSMLWLYTWNLRRRLGWSEDRLENVECVIMLRRRDEDLED
jgi:hypothetical protein